MPQMTYEEACEQAATAQGLDPATEALRAAGMPFTVDQTGGFCMMIRVPFAEEAKRYFGITNNEIGPEYLVYLYDDRPEWDCEGTKLSDATTAEDLAPFIRRAIAS